MKKKPTKISSELNDRGQVRKRFLAKPFLIVLAAELVILMIMHLSMMSIASNSQPLDVSLEKWSSKTMQYSDGSWYTDENITKTDKMIDLLVGPYIHLDKGSYLVTIDYDCSSEQKATATIDNTTKVFIKTGTARLYHTLHSVSFRVQALQDVEDFEVLVKYNGNGSLRINNIEIRKDYAGVGRIFAAFILIFLVCDLVYLYFEKLRENRTTVLALIGITILSSLPLFYMGIGRGHDFDVHIMRIEGIAGELRRGVFPVRMSSDWIEGYGYPVSVYYGDLLLYIPALLRIIGFDVVFSYKVYILIVNAATTIISYYSFKGIFGNKHYGLLLSLAYSTASYRLMNIYIRSAVGEFTAAMFYPLIALALYRIYAERVKDAKAYRRNSLILAVGMSGLICNHVLSTEMAVLILVILCLVLIRSTLRLETIKTYLLAVLHTILISAFFLVPFLDYYTNVHTRINDRLLVGSSDMKQSKGLTLAEYFSFFRDPFSEFSIVKNPRILLTPGMLLMLALVVAVFLIVKFGIKRTEKAMPVYFGFSILILFVASHLFPWDALNHGDAFGKALAQVQFPWRYVGMSLIFLTLLLGSVLKTVENENLCPIKKPMIAAVLICILTTTSFTGQYLDGITFVKYYNGADLNTSFVGMGEYIRSGASYRSIDGKVISENTKKAKITERNGCHIELDIKNGDKEGSVTLPVFNYKGYCAVDENGRTIEITDGENAQIKLLIPSGYKGKVTVDFKPPVLWRISELVSLISVLYFCFGKKLIKRRKQS